MTFSVALVEDGWKIIEYVRGIEGAIVFTATFSFQLFQHLSTFVFCSMQRPYASFVPFPLFRTYGFRLRRTVGIILPDAEVGCVIRFRGHCIALLVSGVAASRQCVRLAARGGVRMKIFERVASFVCSPVSHTRAEDR
jgi:hypothetical protein